MSERPIEQAQSTKSSETTAGFKVNTAPEFNPNVLSIPVHDLADGVQMDERIKSLQGEIVAQMTPAGIPNVPVVNRPETVERRLIPSREELAGLVSRTNSEVFTRIAEERNNQRPLWKRAIGKDKIYSKDIVGLIASEVHRRLEWDDLQKILSNVESSFAGLREDQIKVMEEWRAADITFQKEYKKALDFYGERGFELPPQALSEERRIKALSHITGPDLMEAFIKEQKLRQKCTDLNINLDVFACTVTLEAWDITR